MFIAVNSWSGSKLLVFGTRSLTEISLEYPSLSLSYVDSVAMVCQEESIVLSCFLEVIGRIYVGVGHLKTLEVDMVVTELVSPGLHWDHLLKQEAGPDLFRNC